MNNLSIYTFKQAIQNYIKENELPEEVKRLVLKEILEEQSQATLTAIREEITKRDAEEQDGEEVKPDE